MGYDNYLVGLYAASRSDVWPAIVNAARESQFERIPGLALSAEPVDYVRIPLYVMGYKKLKSILGVNSPF